jgi:hypothetical protein
MYLMTRYFEMLLLEYIIYYIIYIIYCIYFWNLFPSRQFYRYLSIPAQLSALSTKITRPISLTCMLHVCPTDVP